MDDVETRWTVIQARLRRHGEWLVRSGSVVRKPHRKGYVWAVRFRYRDQGRMRIGSIYVGKSPELVERTRELLQRYRQQRARRAELKHLTCFCRALVAVVKRNVAGGRRAARKPKFIACKIAHVCGAPKSTI